MLARLDETPGVLESRVNWTGQFFLLKLAPDAEAARTVPLAAAKLGPKARRLDPAAEREQIAAFRRGEPWPAKGETLKLSREEARVLAERHGGEAAKEAALDDAQTRSLIGVLEGELVSAFEAAEEGERSAPGRFLKEWVPISKSVAEKSRTFLSQEQAERVRKALALAFPR